jgi:hypothetical protein
MTEEHPITPSPELFKQWEDDILNKRDNVDHVLDCAWRNGFQAGADAELEACRLWVSENESIYDAEELVEYRRPKPKTLKEMKERGLKALGECYAYIPDDLYHEIKKVIESLPDES